MPAVGETREQLYAQMFGQGIELLPQQMGSKLKQFGMIHDLNGAEVKWIDFIEALDETAEVLVKTGRNAKTRQSGVEFSKRAIDANRFSVATLTDNLDLVRSLNDPQNPITITLAQAMGRREDRIIIAALNGNSRKRAGTGFGSYTNTNVALPSTQKVAVDYVETGATTDSNLTIGKLRRIRAIFLENDVEVDGAVAPLVYVGGASQQQALLRSSEVNNIDTNAVRALVNGEVDTYMGFRFVWMGTGPNSTVPLLPKTSANVRTNFAFPNGDGFAFGEHLAGRRVRVTERDDLQYTNQIFMEMDVGATRVVEKHVVEILCDEDL